MIPRLDRAPHVLGTHELRDRLLAGESIGKDFIIRSTSIDHLSRHTLQSSQMPTLTQARCISRDLFAHTSMWIRFAENATSRSFRYRRLTTEQVALLVIYNHKACVTPQSFRPANWLHSPDVDAVNHADTSDSPHHLVDSITPVVAVWLTHEWLIQRGYDLDAVPTFSTRHLDVEAIIQFYRPETTTAERKRIIDLISRWSPRYTPSCSLDASHRRTADISPTSSPCHPLGGVRHG